jgi:hypothetical protein
LQPQSELLRLCTARKFFQGIPASSKQKRKRGSTKQTTKKSTTSKKKAAGKERVAEQSDGAIEDEIEEVDELDGSEDEAAPLKKKQKTTATREDTPDIEAAVYIFIVIPPPPITHIRNRSTKPPPEQHRQRPPFMFSIDLPYKDFIEKVASATPCYPEALTRMMWKFEKPMKGNTKPLTTETSYAAMIKQLRKKTKDHVVNIYMPPPNKLDNRPTVVSNHVFCSCIIS